MTSFPALSTDPGDPDVWGAQLKAYVDEHDAALQGWYESTVAQGFENTWTALAWEIEVSDPSGGHSTSTNPSRWVAPADGVFNFEAQVCYSSSQVCYLQFAINGTRVPGRTLQGGGSNYAIALSRTFHLSAGDYVEVCVYSGSGSGATTASVVDDHSAWTITKLG